MHFGERAHILELIQAGDDQGCILSVGCAVDAVGVRGRRHLRQLLGGFRLLAQLLQRRCCCHQVLRRSPPP